MTRMMMIAGSAALLLAGCSDPKKPSKANFQHAVQAYLDKHPLCLNAPTSDVRPAGQTDYAPFPIYVPLPSNPNGADLFKNETRYPDALVSAGLLSAKNGTIPSRGMFSSTTTQLPVKVYELTALGKSSLPKTDASGKGPATATGGFCYGTPDVKEVTQFTEPSPAMGITMSQVSYTYRLKDSPSWSSNAAMLAAYPILARTSGDASDGKATVVLTNNGWVDARDSKF